MSSLEYDILVTGSSGHLGAALMLCLPSHGHTPLGIDILPSSTTTHTLSITDRAALTTLFTSHPSIKHIIHAATLHKPHVASHPKQAFIDTNITGTLALLETSSAHLPSLRSFIFISTTSTYGSALAPAPGSPAAWITEPTPPPFPDDGDTLARLNAGAGAGAEGVYRACVPAAGAVFEKLGWRFPDSVDRVYDSARAVRELGWRPEWTFEKVVERLARGEDWRSELTRVVGKRGYHDVPTGVYTT
ncbi:hypothetical protein CKAH01_11410 [Colletotrichum kahawae]|uniref:NAD-dependent epimerase/dehydratase domain-containing protein n=1 Tax=Colletotrichum kahawae TaxID=34407 RepID=A0AAE0DGF5_COLKA|nr:hypothetical protein CKAH01_11410 [Colletotrichum kahawae]